MSLDERLPSKVTSELPFPSLSTWREEKIKDLCRCLVLLFNYLAKPRLGFLQVATDDPAGINPVITREMASYLVSELMPCGDMSRQEMFEITPVPEEISQKMERLIIEGVGSQYPQFTAVKNRTKGTKPVKKLLIEPSVYQVLWNYISNGLNALMLESISSDGTINYVESNDQVAEKIVYAQTMASGRRNCNKNYGFNDELENCVFQALLYVTTGLSDWLETDEITSDEVETAYKIIVPKDLQVDLQPVKIPRLTDIITSAIVSKDLIPTDESVRLLASIMNNFSKIMNKTGDQNIDRIINRYMVFCNHV